MSDTKDHPLKTVVATKLAPAALPGILSQAIISGNTVYCSGSLGIDPQTNQLVGPTVSERTTQALANLKNVLEAAGSGFDKIVKTTIYLTDIENYAAVNKAYENAFKGTVVPARTCIAVYQLPLKSDVEIECIAHLANPSVTTGDIEQKFEQGETLGPEGAIHSVDNDDKAIPKMKEESQPAEQVSSGGSKPEVKNRLFGDW